MRPTVNLNNKRDLLHNPLHSPHDLSHQQEIRDDLPTLLGDVKAKSSLERVKVFKVKLGIFNKMPNGHTVCFSVALVFSKGLQMTTAAL